ncbi:cytochrome c biogenesis heme-transporting ATPase CcmA [soil metagenome]
MSLEARKLSCTRGERELFADVSFEVNPGDALRIVGTNGSGKTSMLRILCGLTPPVSGEVCWNGQNIKTLREEFCSQLVYLGHANGVKDDLLAWENVAVSCNLSGAKISREEAIKALEDLGLSGTVNLPAHVLSQGQRKRVALARLRFAESAPLWILDEPFAALDHQSIAELCVTLNAHLKRGGMVVFTTHQEIELAAARMLRVELLTGEDEC